MAGFADNLSIAYVDAAGRDLASEDGFHSIGLARAAAKSGFESRIYPRAVKVVIYRGRTLADGSVLEEFPKGS